MKFTAFSFLSLDYSPLFTILGGVTTYLVTSLSPCSIRTGPVKPLVEIYVLLKGNSMFCEGLPKRPKRTKSGGTERERYVEMASDSRLK
jgi:hypothetical protein